MTVNVRHGGDPLLAAINITPKPGSLDFGEKSYVELKSGVIFLILSVALLVVDCYYILKTNQEANAEKQGYKRDIQQAKKAQRYRQESSEEEEVKK